MAGLAWPGWHLQLPTHQRTAAVLERTEGLRGRNGRKRLVEVTRILGLFGLLHLEEIRRMDLAAIGADCALAEQRIVGRHLLHPGDDSLAVRIAAERDARLEIMQHAG